MRSLDPLTTLRADLKRDSIAVFLDFDGTLVDIAETPGAIVVPPELPNLLRGVNARLSGALAVISGRAIAVIDHFLGGAVRPVAGLHGWELRDGDGTVSAHAAHLPDFNKQRRVFERLASQHPGIVIEDKGASIAVHYRLAPESERICRLAVEDAATYSNGVLAAVHGKCVAELKVATVNKGGAMVTFMRAHPFKGRTPLFIGDDLTDEAAFLAARKVGGYGVLVGEPRETAARAHLASVREVHRWLEQLVS